MNEIIICLSVGLYMKLHKMLFLLISFSNKDSVSNSLCLGDVEFTQIYVYYQKGERNEEREREEERERAFSLFERVNNEKAFSLTEVKRLSFSDEKDTQMHLFLLSHKQMIKVKKKKKSWRHLKFTLATLYNLKSILLH